jgi:antitoxin component YwqK of YwqJK toxin-antitoxin module
MEKLSSFMLGIGCFLNLIIRTIKIYKVRIFVILSIFCFTHPAVTAQTDSINQLDSSGNKDGTWRVYYNAKGKEVGDSSHATYYRYTWYEHGKNTQDFEWCGSSDKIISATDTVQYVGLKLLHGEYKITDKRGSVKSIHVFNEGQYVSYRTFYSNGKLREYCNFQNQHFERGEFEPHTYCRRSYNKVGQVKYQYMRGQPDHKNPSGDSLWHFEGSYFDSTSITILKRDGDSTFATVTKYRGGRAIRQVDQIIIKGQRPIAHGAFTFWYISGQKKEAGFYHYNEKVGEWKQWNIDGTEIEDYPDYNQLNQVNKNGEKTGWWITYLDENLKILEDSIGASHCMYNYYTGKFYHYRFGGMNELGSKKFPVHFPANDSLKFGNFSLLNGDYTTYYEDGKIRSVLSASNGVLTEYKQYFEDGKLHLHFIYSAYCGAPIRFCIKQYDKNGNLKYDTLGMVPQDYRKEYR